MAGAGSRVTEDVPGFIVILGNPARVIKLNCLIKKF